MPPSLKSQAQEVGLPVEVSVKMAVSVLAVLTVKEATSDSRGTRHEASLGW